MYKDKWYYSTWFIASVFAFSSLIFPVIIGLILLGLQINARIKFKKKLKENGFFELEDIKKKHDALISEHDELQSRLRAEQEQLEQIIEQRKAEVQGLYEEIQAKQDNLASLERELATIESFDLYPLELKLNNSEVYKEQLGFIRNKQKTMINEKKATTYYDAGQRVGQTNANKEIRMMLRTFNMECDMIMVKAKLSNIEASENKIKKSCEQINKMNEHRNIKIRDGYLKLKLEELNIIKRYEEAKQQELEEQRAIREQMRLEKEEEEKLKKEMQEAMKKIEKEEQHFKQALEELHTQVSKTDDVVQNELLAKIKELEAQLAEVEKNKEDVLNRQQNTRAGYVYIISNVGSFGEYVYKIGMTRRLEPLERVKELGDASVPFLFDVHAMIFSDDAPAFENALHKAFHHKRVNRVNERKEFFRVTLEEIEDVVKKNHNKVVEFTKLAEAAEYRKTLQMEKGLNQEDNEFVEVS
jgi:hypothetical protein